MIIGPIYAVIVRGLSWIHITKHILLKDRDRLKRSYISVEKGVPVQSSSGLYSQGQK